MKKITQMNIGFNKVVTFAEIRKLKGKSVCDIAAQLYVNSNTFAYQLKKLNPELFQELIEGYKSEHFPMKALVRGSKAFREAAAQCTPIKDIKGYTRETREEEDYVG